MPEIVYETLKYCSKTGKPLPLTGKGMSLPTYENSIRLRYLSAIKNKYCSRDSSGKRRGILTYLKRGIISRSDGVIIAINSSNIEYENPYTAMPLIIKSCFGFGDFRIHLKLNRKTNSTVASHTSFDRREIAKKANKETIHSDIFLRPSYPYISAILFSYVNLSRNPFHPEIIIIHNPFAKNPIPPNTLNVDAEFFLSDVKYNNDRSLIVEADLEIKNKNIEWL